MGTGTGAQGVADGKDDRRAGRARFRNGPPLLGLAAAVALGFAALCLHAAGAAPEFSYGPLAGYWLGLVLVAGIGGSSLALKYRVRQEERPGMSEREQRFTRLAFVGVFAILACTLVAVIVIGSGQPHGTEPPLLPSPQPTVTWKVSPSPVTVSATPSQATARHALDLLPFLLTAVGIGAAAVLGWLVFLLVRWLRKRDGRGFALTAPPAPEAEQSRLAEAVSAGRLALRGDDTRAAVIACYAAMEESLAANGVGRHASDSPADLLRRASGAGVLTSAAPAALADLFREARFSGHPMGREQLRRARTALDEIDRELTEHQARADAEAAEADAWLKDEKDKKDEKDGTDGTGETREADAPGSRREAVSK